MSAKSRDRNPRSHKISSSLSTDDARERGVQQRRGRDAIDVVSLFATIISFVLTPCRIRFPCAALLQCLHATAGRLLLPLPLPQLLLHLLLPVMLQSWLPLLHSSLPLLPLRNPAHRRLLLLLLLLLAL